MIVHRHIKGVDCDAFEDFMRFLRPGLSVRPMRGSLPFAADCRLGEVADIKVWRTQYGRGASYTARDEVNGLLILAPRIGAVHAPGVIDDPLGRDRLLSVWDPQLIKLDILEGASTDGMLVPMAKLSSRLSERLDRPLTAPLRFSPTHDATEGPAASVRYILSGLLTALQSPVSIRDGAALKGVSASLVDLILEVLPHTFSEAMRAPAPRIAPRQVRRAIAYIHDCPMPVLTVDDLAVICEVSSRSLQYAFRAFVGMTPGEYWRGVRRDRAIDQLRRQPSASILEVANAWGFTNVTRFRALCRAAGADDILYRSSYLPALAS